MRSAERPIGAGVGTRCELTSRGKYRLSVALDGAQEADVGTSLTAFSCRWQTSTG